MVEIIAFYEFKDMAAISPLVDLKTRLKAAIVQHKVRGTIILASEGYNGMVCGASEAIADFVADAEQILQTTLRVKGSFNENPPFRRMDVKIKPEIVTLKRPVDISLGEGTHVSA